MQNFLCLRPFRCLDSAGPALIYTDNYRVQRKKPHRKKPVRQVTFVNYFLSKRFGAERLPSKPFFGIGFAVCSDLGAL